MYVLYEDLWDPLEGLYSPCVYCHTIHPHSALLFPPSMILSETLLGNTYNEEILHTLLILCIYNWMLRLSFRKRKNLSCSFNINVLCENFISKNYSNVFKNARLRIYICYSNRYPNQEPCIAYNRFLMPSNPSQLYLISNNNVDLYSIETEHVENTQYSHTYFMITRTIQLNQCCITKHLTSMVQIGILAGMGVYCSRGRGEVGDQRLSTEVPASPRGRRRTGGGQYPPPLHPSLPPPPPPTPYLLHISPPYHLPLSLSSPLSSFD